MILDPTDLVASCFWHVECWHKKLLWCCRVLKVYVYAVSLYTVTACLGGMCTNVCDLASIKIYFFKDVGKMQVFNLWCLQISVLRVKCVTTSVSELEEHFKSCV